MSSNNEDVSGEDLPDIAFTQQETYDQLLEEKNKYLLKLDRLCEHLRNNGIKPIGDEPNVREFILKERIKFVQCLDQQMKKKQPDDLPMLNTDEAVTASVKYLENQVEAARQLNKKLEEEIEAEKVEIAKLETMKTNFKTMEKIHLTEQQKEVTESYQAELVNVKKVFNDTKEDLETLTDNLFPENEKFKDCFMELCASYFSGGDDVYVQVEDESAGIIDFLIECDLITYHPHDKKRVRLMNLL